MNKVHKRKTKKNVNRHLALFIWKFIFDMQTIKPQDVLRSKNRTWYVSFWYGCKIEKKKKECLNRNKTWPVYSRRIENAGLQHDVSCNCHTWSKRLPFGVTVMTCNVILNVYTFLYVCLCVYFVFPPWFRRMRPKKWKSLSKKKLKIRHIPEFHHRQHLYSTILCYQTWLM